MNDIVRIGELEVDLAALEVRGRDQVRKIEPRAAAVLSCLAREPGRVISREELVRSVWGHPHVSKDTLAVTVHRLRQALGQTNGSGSGDGPVETVPRRGYRLRLPEHAGRHRFGSGSHRWPAAAGLGAAAVLVFALSLHDGLPPMDPDGPAATLARAESLWERREPEAAQRAVALAKQALEQAQAGGHVAARAHAMLGRFYGYKTAHWLGLKRETAAELGRRHLEQALAATPDDPAVRTTAASFALYTERDARRAYALAQQALALDSGRVATRQVYAKAAAAAGDRDTAVSTIRALAAEAPADGGVQWDRAFILFLAGRHEESLEALNTAVSLSRRDPYWLTAFNRHAMGQHREAAAIWAGHLRRNGCPVRLAPDAATSFRRLLAAEAGCLEGFAYHRGLWAFYAGEPELARQHFEAARTEDDYMLIWQALNPLPYIPSAMLASG